MSVDESLGSFRAAMILEVPTPVETMSRKLGETPTLKTKAVIPESSTDDAAPAKLNVPFQPSYNRIASTLSNAFTPNSGISHSPWDMIEAINRPPEDLPPYTIYERPSNLEESSEEGSQASSTSFDLSEALEDIKELDGMEGSELVKPLEELRTILVNAAVPVRERVEILKNLQLRDNWLLFLAKHFRRVLTKIKKESDHVDERVRCLQTIFGQIAENKVPPANVSETSTLVEQGTSPTPPVGHALSSGLRMSVHAEPSEEDEPTATLHASRGALRSSLSQSEHKAEPPKARKEASLKIIGTTKRSPEIPATAHSEGGSHRESRAHQSVTSAVAESLSHPPSSTTSSESCAYDVYQVVSVHKEASRYPFCIKVVASSLGRQPLESSGLRHFSPSCERRARAHEWAQAQRTYQPPNSNSTVLYTASDRPAVKTITKKAVERSLVA